MAKSKVKIESKVKAKSTTKSTPKSKSNKLTFKEYNEKRIALVNQIDEINSQIDKLEIRAINPITKVDKL